MTTGPTIARRAPRPRVDQSSHNAIANIGSARTADGQPAHIADLGTLCRNTIRIGNSDYTFTRLTTPTELQAAAFELAGVTPGK